MDEAELERLGARVAAAAELVELRAASLARVATPWWEGPAAEAWAASADGRRVRLVALADELRRLASAVHALAAAVRADPGAGPGRAS